MADTALTGLPAASAPDADDLFYLVEDGVSVKATGTQVAALMASIIVPSDIGAEDAGAAAAAVAAHTGDTSDAHDASAISIVDSGGYYTGTDVEAALQEIGADIALLTAGAGVSGLDYTADTASQADSDPGTGNVRWNNATQASATTLYIDNATADGTSMATFFAEVTSGSFITLHAADDPHQWQKWKVTSTPVDGTGYYKFAVSLEASEGSAFADDEALLIDFDIAGSSGAVDSDDVTYTPTTLADWDGSADPGDVEQALDQLAERVTDLEVAGGGTAGRHAIYIAAASMIPSATGGCASLATIASAANQPDISTLDFDATTQEYAQFGIVMPKSWNEGTVTFKAHWSHAATVTNFGVVWDLQALAVSDDDAIAQAFGTAQTSTDTGGTTNDLYASPESSAITVAGTPAAEDMVFFRLSRVTGDGSDTMAIDARLHGITLYITTDAENDA